MRRQFLSLDWDYVVGDCMGAHIPYCGFCIEGGRAHYTVKDRRTSQNIREDMGARLQQVKRFQLAIGAPIWVAECHASIVSVLRRYKGSVLVRDYDYHFDAEPSEEWDYSYDWQGYLVTTRRTVHAPLHCANWVIYVKDLGHHIQNYSAPDAKLSIPRSPFIGMFFCLSSPWTPGAQDKNFFALLQHFVALSGSRPRFIGHHREALQIQWRKYKCPQRP